MKEGVSCGTRYAEGAQRRLLAEWVKMRRTDILPGPRLAAEYLKFGRATGTGPSVAAGREGPSAGVTEPRPRRATNFRRRVAAGADEG